MMNMEHTEQRVQQSEQATFDIFLAHANRDEEIARDVHQRLSRFANVFLDVVSIPPGEEWTSFSAGAHVRSRMTVLIISDAWQQAEYFRDEIVRAIAFRRESKRKHVVVPMYLDGMPSDMTLVPLGLSNTQGIDVVRFGLTAAIAAIRKVFEGDSVGHGDMPDASGAQVVTAHRLHQYPIGPYVPIGKIPDALIDAFAAIVESEQAPRRIDWAANERIAADPNDPEVTVVRHSDLPPYLNVPAGVYWRRAFTEAGLHGPRMLAALVLTLSDRKLPETAKKARTDLLEALRHWR